MQREGQTGPRSAPTATFKETPCALTYSTAAIERGLPAPAHWERRAVGRAVVGPGRGMRAECGRREGLSR